MNWTDGLEKLTPSEVWWVLVENSRLGGGFKDFFFSPLLREMIQFDEHIFQMGWFNHQLAGFVSTSDQKFSILESRFFLLLDEVLRNELSVFFGTMVSEECFLTSPKNETFFHRNWRFSIDFSILYLMVVWSHQGWKVFIHEGDSAGFFGMIEWPPLLGQSCCMNDLYNI